MLEVGLCVLAPFSVKDGSVGGGNRVVPLREVFDDVALVPPECNVVQQRRRNHLIVAQSIKFVGPARVEVIAQRAWNRSGRIGRAEELLLNSPLSRLFPVML